MKEHIIKEIRERVNMTIKMRKGKSLRAQTKVISRKKRKENTSKIGSRNIGF